LPNQRLALCDAENRPDLAKPFVDRPDSQPALAHVLDECRHELGRELSWGANALCAGEQPQLLPGSLVRDDSAPGATGRVVLPLKEDLFPARLVEAARRKVWRND